MTGKFIARCSPLVCSFAFTVACSESDGADGKSPEGGAAGTGGSSPETGGTGNATGGRTGSGGDGAPGSGGSAAGGNAGSSAGGTGGTGGISGAGGAPEPPDPSCDGIGLATDDTGTTPGDPTSPWPTLRHLTLVWPVSGDTDDDGVVTVRYRPTGTSTWSEGPPLRHAPADTLEGFSWENRHAGSLFGLEPGTTYEVEVHLVDPDGGCATRSLQVATRAVPAAAPSARVVPATPSTLSSLLSDAVPGDVLELAAGTYASFTVSADGTAEAPLVVRGQAGVVVTGDVRIDGRSHVIVEGLTVQGQIKFNAGIGITVRRCTVNAVEDGIVMRTRGENAYIADNVVTGVTEWAEPALGVDGANVGEGILVTGPGHVIEHNRVTGFRDGISFLEDAEAVEQVSIDVVGNDIYEAADDGVEADFCFHDCRVVGNRLTNTFIALSSQPGLGGPTYFVRNVMYNVILSAFKLQRGSIGDVVWHNTVVKNGDALGIYTSDVFSRQLFRNNLFIGGPGGDYNGYSSGRGDVIGLAAAGAKVDLDYDAFGSVTGQFSGRIGGTRFANLAELQSTTTATHALEVGLEVFAAQVPYPNAPFPALGLMDLRPASGSSVADTAVRIPGVNDTFAGTGPDRGALEAGEALPAYGPRP